MKKLILCGIVGIILIISLSFFMYRYHYQEITVYDEHGYDSKVSIRTNAFTGDVDQYHEDQGWVSVQ